MNIEQEISQTSFKDAYHKAIVNMIFTYHWALNIMKSDFQPYDITIQQYNILRILRGQSPKPATINLLKERMLDKMCDASRMVDRLLQKDLIVRTINRKDRRAVDIFISEKGKDLLMLIDKEHEQKNIFANLSEEEAILLSDLFDKLRA